MPQSAACRRRRPGPHWPEEVRVSVHVADPKRLAALVVAVVIIAIAVLVLTAVTTSEPVPIGRS